MQQKIKKEKRVALITGGSSGLGLALVKILLEQGWYVYNISRQATDLCPKENQFNIKLNIASCTKSFLKKITHKHIDLLINNAGIAYVEDDKKMSSDFNTIFRTNFLGPTQILSLLNKKIINGTVINISSDLSYFPANTLAFYSASKSALNAYFTSLSIQHNKIRFITILPGMMDTPLLHRLLGNSYSKYKDNILKPLLVANVIMQIYNDQKIKSGSEIFVSHKKIKRSISNILDNKILIDLTNLHEN